MKFYIYKDGKTIRAPWIKLIDGTDAYGYKMICIDRKKRFQHKILYEKFHNIVLQYPRDEVDHINEKKDDNRIMNLRVDTKKKNSQNRGKNTNNTSGYKNISFHKVYKKWSVKISKTYYGFYDKIEDAVIARNNAIIELNNNGCIYKI